MLFLTERIPTGDSNMPVIKLHYNVSMLTSLLNRSGRKGHLGQGNPSGIQMCNFFILHHSFPQTKRIIFFLSPNYGRDTKLRDI